MPVAGEYTARNPLAAGSIRAMSVPSISSSPRRPLASPRRLRFSSRASSFSRTATISLPVSGCSIPCLSQNSRSSAAPRMQSLAFSEPGA